MKTTLFLLMLLFSQTMYGQRKPERLKLSQAEYIQKAKSQKNWAWIALGTGITIATVSLLLHELEAEDKPKVLLGNYPYTTDTHEDVASAGVGLCVLSIPLFIESSSTKKKAVSLSLHQNTSPLFKRGGMASSRITSLSVKVNLAK
ncbi:hypothetical protein [Rufibacter hautae]|uniref:Uncharacterized protein n=1 Tax=Rufibacter hautae TaxID=2595005 RepID=A0A5B6TD44_9BACT|nr:hypothetical protein [Rufibacter hautae]KAA3437821.1 hypothetical protein FOA19_11050 [Rufibacter hautae]